MDNYRTGTGEQLIVDGNGFIWLDSNNISTAVQTTVQASEVWSNNNYQEENKSAHSSSKETPYLHLL